jgi:peroxiredoxin
MPLSVGTKAPDFTLRTMTADGLADWTLSDNFGKRNTVLLFFPAAFTAPCTQELCDVSQGLGFRPGAETQVVGISVDSPFGQDGWAKAKGITIPLLSDYARKVIHAYEVVLADFAGTGGEAAARAAFVIDKQGVIRHSEQTPTPKDLPDFSAIQAVLSSL